MKKGSSKECKKAGDTLTLGTTDDLEQRRAEFHLERCAHCQQDEEIMEGMRRTVLAANDSLDDLTRVRVQARLAEAMEQAASGAAESVPLWQRRGARIAALAAVVLAVVTASVIWWTDPRPAGVPGEGKAPAASVAVNRVLQPRSIVEGSSTWPNSGLHLGRKVARLRVPAGVALRAGLAQQAELTLYGPLELMVEKVTGDRIELRLPKGILIGDYDHSRGRALRIRSPRAVTEVVGTLFSIEAHDGQSRISVSRGRVKVHGAGKTAVVGAHKTWSTRTSRVGETPPAVTALFARYDPQPTTAGEVATASTGEQRGVVPAVEPGATPVTVHRSRAVHPRAMPQTSPVTGVPAASPKATPAPAAPVASQKVASNQRPSLTPPTASVLYRSAEQALKRRDLSLARQKLHAILKTYPKDPLVDAARYELALLLLKSGKRSAADAMLSRVGQVRSSRLGGPAHYLRCRIKQESRDAQGAMACYRAFKDAFPASPHHQQALEELIRLSAVHKECSKAPGLIADYLAQYPDGPFAREASRLRRGCRK